MSAKNTTGKYIMSFAEYTKVQEDYSGVLNSDPEIKIHMDPDYEQIKDTPKKKVDDGDNDDDVHKDSLDRGYIGSSYLDNYRADKN